MGNFGGGNCPQNNPPSLFGGGMPPQQRGQTGMTGMGGGSHPSFGVSNLQTNSLQQQAHNQFMMHRQGNIGCFTFLFHVPFYITLIVLVSYLANQFIFSRNEQPKWPTRMVKSKSR